MSKEEITTEIERLDADIERVKTEWKKSIDNYLPFYIINDSHHKRLLDDMITRRHVLKGIIR